MYRTLCPLHYVGFISKASENFKREAKDTRSTFKLISRKLTENAMSKKEKDTPTNNITQNST